VEKDHGGSEKQERKGRENTRNDTANAIVARENTRNDTANAIVARPIKMDKTISLSSWKREQFKRQEAQSVWHPKHHATIVQAIGGRPHGHRFSLRELRE